MGVSVYPILADREDGGRAIRAPDAARATAAPANVADASHSSAGDCS